MARFAVVPVDGSEIDLRIDPSYYISMLSERKIIHEQGNMQRLSGFLRIVSLSCNPRKVFGEDLFSYIDISSVDNSTGLIRSKRMKGVDAPSRARKRVQEGDVLISSVRPEKNAVALITSTESGFVCSTGFIVCRPKANRLKPGFLFVLLKSTSVVNQLVRRITATMYPNINKKDVLNLMVRIPSLDVQECISNEVINSLERLREHELKLQLMVENVDELQNDDTKLPEALRLPRKNQGLERFSSE